MFGTLEQLLASPGLPATVSTTYSLRSMTLITFLLLLTWVVG